MSSVGSRVSGNKWNNVSTLLRRESALAPQCVPAQPDRSRRAVRATVPDSHTASAAMASAARVARAAPNQIAPSAGSGTGSGGQGPGPGPGPGPVPAAIPAAVPQAPPALPPRRPSARSSWRSTTPPCTRAWTSCTASTPRTRRCPWRAPPRPRSPRPASAPSTTRSGGSRRGARVTVTSVDALHSAHGAVVVVVTGRAIPGAAENEPTEAIATGRGFTQTFVLAPQRNGFYVKNDLVRFLPPEPPEPPRSDVRLIGTTPSLSVKSGPGPTQPGPDAGPDAGPEKRAPPALVGESQSLEAVEAKLAAAAARRLSLSAPSDPSDSKDASSKDASSKDSADTAAPPPNEAEGSEKKAEAPPAGPPSYATALLKARAAAAAAGTRGETATRAPTFRAKSGIRESSGNAAVTVRAKPPLASADPRTADAGVRARTRRRRSRRVRAPLPAGDDGV